MLQFLKKAGSIWSALFGFTAGFGFAIVVIALKRYNDNRRDVGEG